ncbi:retrotransposon protein [Hordeum vulgare]|nr:retrotransposon protein [Hordeum vulgare]
MVSLTVPMLTSENYTVWAIKVEANLNALGLREAVLLADDTAVLVITKKDKPTRAYLLEALIEDILLHVSSKKVTVELRASLKMRFDDVDREKDSIINERVEQSMNMIDKMEEVIDKVGCVIKDLEVKDDNT